MPESGLLIGGAWLDDGPEHPVHDRYSNKPVATIRHAESRHVSAAVTRAAEAVATGTLSPRDRAGILHAAADLLAKKSAKVVADYVAETGFTQTDARVELERACETLHLSAEEGLRLCGEVVPIQSAPGSHGRFAFTIRTPVGVVAAIVPFNAPLNTLAHKVGPALAAGNAVVIKPAEATPLSASHVCSALLDAGLPPGYLSLLPGPGGSVGRSLVEDSRVRYITFTGSTDVGLFIKQHSGIAKTHLELGSVSATIVCEDADIDLVADLITRGGYRKAGQVCTSVQRVIALSPIAESLQEALLQRVREIPTGDPLSPTTQLGPMISESEAERACQWVEEVVAGGGRVLTGATRVGALMAATVLADVPEQSRLMRDEIFAPVVALQRVDTFDDAIAMANSTRYGLQAGLFTRDVERAFRALYHLEVGGVIVNDTSSYHADLMPYGGVKDSGYGSEGPRYAVEDMTNPRIIVFNNVVPPDRPALQPRDRIISAGS